MFTAFELHYTYRTFHFTAAFHKQKEDIHLETCCITGDFDMTCFILFRNISPALPLPNPTQLFSVVAEMNDIVVEGTNRPVIYGIGK